MLSHLISQKRFLKNAELGNKEYEISHILVKDQKTAEDIEKKLAAGGTLDEHESVMITARLGNSQQMMPANGDLEGQTSAPVKVGADDVTLKLTNVIAR